MGDAVAADSTSRNSSTAKTASPWRTIGGGDVAVEGERQRLPLGMVSTKAPSRSMVALTFNQVVGEPVVGDGVVPVDDVAVAHHGHEGAVV